MYKIFHFNLISTILVGILISSCTSKNENFDIDLSNLKISKKSADKNSITDIPDSSKIKNKIIKNELNSYQNKSDILNSIKLGKIDPFSEGEIKLNNLTSDFQLTGILSTKINKYAFVSYLGREGTITPGSIGGINTLLLPNGAKVININTKSLKLIINFENKEYIFEL